MNNKLVCVYGSLKRNFSNHKLLEGSEMVGEMVTEPVYAMYHLGGFPGIVRNGDGHIHCEVYSVDEHTFEGLDMLEGYPRLYNRELIETKWGTAWIYFLADEPWTDVIINDGIWK